MKNSLYKTILTIILLLRMQCGFSQSFINLSFESPLLPLNPVNSQVPITSALPGWNGYIGGNQISQVLYNSRNIDAAGISLHSSTSPYFQPLEGSYSVFLEGSSIFAPTADAAIAQTSLVPLTAMSLRLFMSPGSNLQIKFGDQVIPLFQLGAAANYNIMGGDVSAFAGSTGELRLTALPHFGAYLDNIFFSNQPIPEPGAIGFFVFGALLLGWRLRKL